MEENQQKKEVYRTGPVSLFELTTKRGTRVILDLGSDGVLIVPVSSSGKYFLITQVRPGKDTPTLEFPSGGIKDGESPEAAAERELREEIGATGTLTPLGTIEPLSGIVKFSTHVFLAQFDDSELGSQNLEEGEDLQIHAFSKEDLTDRILAADLIDGSVISALGLMRVRGLF